MAATLPQEKSIRAALLALLFVLVVSQIIAADDHGVGGGAVPISRCILTTERRVVQAGALLPPKSIRPRPTATPVKYFDPVGGGGINSSGKTITNYVDLDTSANIKDYNCGTISYDGHHGTDIEILNFYDMDEGVPIVCAASGSVIYVHDGEFDRQTALVNTAIGNAVIVRHADNSEGWYWHMRKNSVRVKVGDSVNVGDTLGFVGSSGFSTGPHLHFEIEQNSVIDPFTGACQPDSSRWVAQTPYVLTLPSQVTDHGVTTIPLTWETMCEKPPSKTHVRAGSTVYSWFRLRNIFKGDLLKWEFYSGSNLYTNFSHAVGTTYSSSWWYGYLTPTADSINFGQWTVKVYKNGEQIVQDTYLFDNAENQLPKINDTTIAVAKGAVKSGQFSGTDADGSIFWYKVAAPSKNGTLALWGGRNRKFTYTPNPSFVGKDTILLYAVDDENAEGPIGRVIFDVSSTPQLVANAGQVVPGEFAVSQNYPNPFNPSTTIEFMLPCDGNVTLRIYDLLGREVATLVNGALKGGVLHKATFDASRYSSGVFFSQIQFKNHQVTRKLLLVR